MKNHNKEEHILNSNMIETSPELRKIASIVPSEKLQKMLSDNVYRLVSYRIPFPIIDEIAFHTKGYTYDDWRRIEGVVAATCYQEIRSGHTTWKLQLNNDLKNPTLLENKSLGIQEKATRLLRNSEHLFPEQKQLFTWHDTTKGNKLPRLNDILFHQALEGISLDIKEEGRQVFNLTKGENERFYLNYLPLYWSEYQLVSRMIDILKTDSILQTAAELAEAQSLQLGADASQAKAIKSVFESKVNYWTGGAGSGKTTTIVLLCHLLLNENKNYQIKIVAPTGIAAQRLQEAFEHSPYGNVRDYFSAEENKASTIHRLLSMKPSRTIGAGRTKFSYKKNPLDANIVICDEFTMADVFLARSLLWAVPNSCSVLLVGDPNQLGSVGPGQVLFDLTYRLKDKDIPYKPFWSKLDRVHRVEQGSAIDILANSLLEHKEVRRASVEKALDEAISIGNVEFIYTDSSKETLQLLKKKYFEHEGECTILTPVHEGEVGRISINAVILKEYNKNGYSVGVPIIQNRNNYEYGVMNGEVGIIVKIDEHTLHGEFSNGRMVKVQSLFKEDEWLIAYARSVHKSQGTEEDVVIIPLWKQDNSLVWNSSLLYTAMTRTKKKLIFIGDKEILLDSLHRARMRYTSLPQVYQRLALKKEGKKNAGK